MTREETYDPFSSLTFLDLCMSGITVIVALVIDSFTMLEDRHATVYLIGKREERWRRHHATRA